MTMSNATLALAILFFWTAVDQALAETSQNLVELIGETTVDELTLTFAEGPATRFSNTVIGRTHQQTPLTTFRGYQYVTYFDNERRVCLGRRKLPSGPWDIIRFDDHRFESNDSHNAAVIGICERDGTIHMAFDHHASQLNYRVSKLGAAHNPEKTDWSTDLFGPVLHTLGSVKPAERVTYPRFFRSPDGNLMLFYRGVTSGNGDGMIEEYDGEKHDWTPGLGRFIARDIGTYSAGGDTSSARCPYMNSLSYAGGRLHASWVWRDLFERTHPRNQHDICYIYSDDRGRTWHNSAGELIGRTRDNPVHLDSPGIVVVPIPCGSDLANSNTHYAYADGSFHIVLRHRAEGTSDGTYHHYWRNVAGVWSGEALSFSGDRPKLVGTQDGSLVLVYTNENELLLAKGTPSPQKSHWVWTPIDLPNRQSNYGDAVLDFERWQEDGTLSIYSQEEPLKAIRTKRPEPIDGFPSPLHVVDYRLTNSEDREQPSDFVSLFDGVSLRGWIGDKRYWSVRDGALVGEITPETLVKKNRFLIYEGEIPADFEFIAECRISQHGNSGINYRSELVEGIEFHALRGYQCDIDGQNRYTGSNYEERGRTTLASIGEDVILPPTKDADKSKYVKRNRWTAGVRRGLIATENHLKKCIKNGEWNEVRISAKGNQLEHYINGRLMSRVTDNDRANRRLQGRLGVQVHVGPPMIFEYRNLRMRPL